MTLIRPTALLLAAAALFACDDRTQPERAAKLTTADRTPPAAGGSRCLETRPLLADEEAKVFLGGLSAPGRCHSCEQAMGYGSGCSWQLERPGELIPKRLDASVAIYQAGNTWATTRTARLGSGLYKDVPGLPGEAHAAVIVGKLQIIMRLGDVGEVMLMTASKGAAVDIPDPLADLARTLHARASRSVSR